MVEHTAKEALQMLKKHGFKEYSVRGDHHKFRDSNGHTAILVYSHAKDSVSPGVFKDVKNAISGTSKWQSLHKKHK